MSRLQSQYQIAANGQDSTSDPVAMALSRARRLINFQIGRAGYVYTNVSLKNQLPFPLTLPIDGVCYYYNAAVTNTPFSTSTFYTDLLLWVSQGLLTRGQPADNPLVGPVTNIQSVPNGITGYTDFGPFFPGKRVRFFAYGAEVVAVQEGGLLPLRFYFDVTHGSGFWRAGIDPPAPNGNASLAASFALTTSGTGLTGTWNYLVTFVDERFRESSPTLPVSITLTNQGTKVTITVPSAAPGIGVYGGSNLAYCYLYRDTIGAPGVYYRIAQHTIGLLAVEDFVAGDFFHDAHAYDDAPDASITAGQLAPAPGENDPPLPASFGCIHQNRVFLNDINDPNTLQVSNLGSITQFAALNDPTVPTDGGRLTIGTDQGNVITAIVEFGSVLAVFKRRGAYFVYGDNFTDFIVRAIHQRGCVAPDSACRCDNVVCFLSDDGVYLASYEAGDTVSKISKEIETDLLAMPEAVYQSAQAWYVDSVYYLAVGPVIYAYSFDAQAWTTIMQGSGLLSLGHGIPDAHVQAQIGFGAIGNSSLYGSIVPCETMGTGDGNMQPCDVTCDPTSLLFDGDGGVMNVSVSPANSSVTPYMSFALWLSVTGPATGPGTAVVAALPNPSCTARFGSVQICSQVIQVTQTGATTGCLCKMVSLIPDVFSVDFNAQTVTTSYVETDSSTITEVSFALWLHPQPPVSGGPTTGTIAILVDANNTCADRSGMVQICDQFITVDQAGNPAVCPCSVILSPSQSTVTFSSIGVVTFDLIASNDAVNTPVSTDAPGGITDIQVPTAGSGPCSFHYDSSGLGSIWQVYDAHTYVGHVTICNAVYSLFLTHS